MSGFSAFDLKSLLVDEKLPPTLFYIVAIGKWEQENSGRELHDLWKEFDNSAGRWHQKGMVFLNDTRRDKGAKQSLKLHPDSHQGAFGPKLTQLLKSRKPYLIVISGLYPTPGFAIAIPWTGPGTLDWFVDLEGLAVFEEGFRLKSQLDAIRQRVSKARSFKIETRVGHEKINNLMTRLESPCSFEGFSNHAGTESLIHEAREFYPFEKDALLKAYQQSFRLYRNLCEHPDLEGTSKLKKSLSEHLGSKEWDLLQASKADWLKKHERRRIRTRAHLKKRIDEVAIQDQNAKRDERDLYARYIDNCKRALNTLHTQGVRALLEAKRKSSNTTGEQSHFIVWNQAVAVAYLLQDRFLQLNAVPNVVDIQAKVRGILKGEPRATDQIQVDDQSRYTSITAPRLADYFLWIAQNDRSEIQRISDINTQAAQIRRACKKLIASLGPATLERLSDPPRLPIGLSAEKYADQILEDWLGVEADRKNTYPLTYLLRNPEGNFDYTVQLRRSAESLIKDVLRTLLFSGEVTQLNLSKLYHQTYRAGEDPPDKINSKERAIKNLRKAIEKITLTDAKRLLTQMESLQIQVRYANHAKAWSGLLQDIEDHAVSGVHDARAKASEGTIQNAAQRFFEAFTQQNLPKLPWHFFATESWGDDPKVLTGWAWTHTEEFPIQLHVMLRKGDRLPLFEEAIIGNNSGVNPVLTDWKRLD
jgi:hypothetical protein